MSEKKGAMSLRNKAMLLARVLIEQRPLISGVRSVSKHFDEMIRRAAKDAKVTQESVLDEIARINALRVNRKRDEKPKPLVERFEEWLRALVKSAYRSCGYRRTRHDHTTIINIAPNSDTTPPGIVSSTSQGWQKYGRLGNLTTTYSTHKITVRRNWKSKVFDETDNGLLDWKLILDLEEVDERFGDADYIRVYKAIWAEQGTGTSLNRKEGWIARFESHVFFSTKSASAAYAGLARMIKREATKMIVA